MPSTSKAQHRFMNIAAHSPKFAKSAGIPVSVAKKFIAADTRAGKKAMSRLPQRKKTIAEGA